MIKILLIALTAFLFSGCSALVVNFDREYISKEENNLYKKVDSKEVTIFNEQKDFFKERIGQKFDIKSALLNDIENVFLKQYFSKVSRTTSTDFSNKDFVIHSAVKDFTFEYGYVTGTQITLKVGIKVYQNGQLILDKEYERTEDSKVIFTFHFKGRIDEVYELIHKVYFDILETDFKRDLLNSMK